MSCTKKSSYTATDLRKIAYCMYRSVMDKSLALSIEMLDDLKGDFNQNEINYMKNWLYKRDATIKCKCFVKSYEKYPYNSNKFIETICHDLCELCAFRSYG